MYYYKSSRWNEESLAEIIVYRGNEHPAFSQLMATAQATKYDLWCFIESDDAIDTLEDEGSQESLDLADVIESENSEFVVLDFRDKSISRNLPVISTLYSTDISGFGDDIISYISFSAMFGDTELGDIVRSDNIEVNQIQKYADRGEQAMIDFLELLSEHPENAKGFMAFDY